METHSLNIDGLNMVYSVDGDKSAPPLIMIHGWGSFKGVWRTTIPALKEHYRCIAVDLIRRVKEVRSYGSQPQTQT